MEWGTRTRSASFLIVVAAVVIGVLIKWGSGERRESAHDSYVRRETEFAEHEDYNQQMRGLGIVVATDGPRVEGVSASFAPRSGVGTSMGTRVSSGAVRKKSGHRL